MLKSDKSPISTGFPFLFNPMTIGPLRIKNRIVALPVHTGFAYPDGRVSPWQLKFYGHLARSGAGMIIVANAAVSKDGVVSRFNLRADSDDFIPGLTRLAQAIKDEGATACIQLNHAGRFARFADPLLPSPISHTNLKFNVESLKAFMDFFPFEKRFGLTSHFLTQLKAWNKAMSEPERVRVIEDFASAAYRVWRAGFDLVELHGANGYLLCQYLSAFTNKLKTGYGPDFAKRAAFPLRVFQDVRDRLPENFPIGYRLTLAEWVPEGIDTNEAVRFAHLLEKHGAAYLSVSAGTYNSIFLPDAVRKMADAVYLRNETAMLKKTVRIPVIAAGRITTPAQANSLIQNGIADMAGLGRQLRTDPQWVVKSAGGPGKIISCINCNWCLRRVVLEQGFCCSRWPRVTREKTRLSHMLLTRNFSTLWVITGPKDIETFKRCQALLTPAKVPDNSSRLLFLEDIETSRDYRHEREEFVKWLESTTGSPNLWHTPEYDIYREDQSQWENLILHQIKKHRYGRVFIGSDSGQPWRPRLVYLQRHRVMAKLSFNAHLNRVLVPVDFSPASLLAVKFLQSTLMNNKEFDIVFITIIPGRSLTAENPAHQWKRIRQITGIGKTVPLKVVPEVSNVAMTLADIIRSERFGTVVMGKRGLSGIKRWLMGSVSSAVMDQLTDQTLFLID